MVADAMSWQKINTDKLNLSSTFVSVNVTAAI